jgi:hypothetical protein
MAKSTPRKNRIKEAVSTASDRASTSQAHRQARSHPDIARRAFEIYCERGGHHGHDLDDWLQAEHELRDA